MSTARTLPLYFGARFVRWIIGMFAGILLLIFLVDVLELLRSNGERTDVSFAMLALASALRVPVMMEQVVPFAVLLGSIGAFVTLSGSSQLVVARAAGMSVWQFTRPALALALALGVLSSAVYNPLATAANAYSESILHGDRPSVMTAILSGGTSANWMRQQSGAENAIVHIAGIADGGRTILSPVFWIFGADGKLDRRVEAEVGRLRDGAWQLILVTLVDRSGSPQRLDGYAVPTSVTPEQVSSGLGSPNTISFWRLPAAVRQAVSSSLPAYRFSLAYQMLLARPLLLAAMVLIAATVSLGQTRAGGGGRMILSGIAAGFVLYVVIEIARGLGSEGLVSPILAAWVPPVVALLFGSTVLLFREDG